MQAVHASEIAECAETHTISLSRGAKCGFTITPQGSPLVPPTNFWHPLGAPKFTQNRTCARCVRKGARESAPERGKADLWVPKGAKRCQNGAKMEANGTLKCVQNRGFQKKCRRWFGPIIYYIYTHYRHPPKTSLFDTSQQAKCRSFPHGASDAAPGLQNGAGGAEKWLEWGPPGSPRVPKGPPMPAKMLRKTIENQHPSPGLPPRVLLGCLGYRSASKIRPFLTFPRPTLPRVGGTFTSSLLRYPA